MSITITHQGTVVTDVFSGQVIDSGANTGPQQLLPLAEIALLAVHQGLAISGVMVG